MQFHLPRITIASVNTMTCIYCKQVRPRPSKGEHIMLEGLGGTITIPDVCGGKEGCNQKFGDSIDRELLRNSPVTLHRLLLSKGQDHDQQVFYFREDHGVWLDAFVRVKERRMLVPPQLYVHGDRPILLASPEFETERVALLQTAVDDIARMKRLIYDWPQSTPSRVVYLPRSERYVLRARSEEEASAFLEVLRTKLPELVARSAGRAAENVLLSTEEKPFILPLGTSVNDSPRCAAKMAFNFLSYYFGPAVALRDEFDSVRRYITGQVVDPVRTIEAENGETGWTVDTRHVANWFTTDLTANNWNLLRETHYISLMAQNRHVMAEVGLFGGRSRFHVWFGQVEPDVKVAKPLPAVFVTPIGGGGDRVLAEYDLADALMQAGPYEGSGGQRPGGTRIGPSAS